jgi:hypothetical protein
MIKLLRRLWWYLNDKCTKDGGELEEHINGHYYCRKCGEKN